MKPRSAFHQRASIVLLACLAAVAAAFAAQSDRPREGTFEGNWRFTGSRKKIPYGPLHASVYRVSGPVRITGGELLDRRFDSGCIGVSDDDAGGVARCVWTDDDGNQIFLDLQGKIIGPMGTVREASGQIIAGTGQYKGLTGTVQLDWLFIEIEDDPEIDGRTTEMSGTWRCASR